MFDVQAGLITAALVAGSVLLAWLFKLVVDYLDNRKGRK